MAQKSVFITKSTYPFLKKSVLTVHGSEAFQEHKNYVVSFQYKKTSKQHIHNILFWRFLIHLPLNWEMI